MNRFALMGFLEVALFFIFLSEPTHCIVDTIPPRVKYCPQDINKTVPTGSRQLIDVTWSPPRAVDNSGYTCEKYRSIQPQHKFSINTTTPIKYIFSDCHPCSRDCVGNEATCAFDVTIKEAFEHITKEIQLEDPSFSPTPQEIISPYYPNEYPSESSYQWLVRKTVGRNSSTNGILVSIIKEIQLQLHDVLLINGTDTKEAVTYRGRIPHRMLLYQGTEMDIRLQTGKRGLAILNGFFMEVKEVENEVVRSICNNGYQCQSSSICISTWYLCDRIPDCPLSDDELNCSKMCQDDFTSLPYNMTFDPNDSIKSHPFNTIDHLEWCFNASLGHNIVIEFPPPGNDYLLIQDPEDEFGQDTVVLKRDPLNRRFSYNSTSLWIRQYPDIDGIRGPFSISVEENLDRAYCDTGYQCSKSHVCINDRNDCNGVIDCPLGDDEMKCDKRQCPQDCKCTTTWGSLNITYCSIPWTSHLSSVAPIITTRLDIIKDLGNITSGFFEGLNNLNSLQISSCYVQVSESEAFHGLNNLENLKLIDIGLMTLYNDTFIGLPNLLKLELRDNKLVELEPGAFHEQTNLTNLCLQHNWLSSVPSGLFNSLKQLIHLKLGFNRLTHLPVDIFEGLQKLTTLQLTSNNLRHIPHGLFQPLLDLEEIGLADNGITELAGETFRGLHKLKKIDLVDNNLKYFVDGFFTNITHLEAIYSKNNSISFIQPSLFHGLVNLTCIDLRSNMLEDLPFDSLQGLKKLTQLYLSGNKISSLDPRLLEGHTHLDKLELQDNAIRTLQSGHFKDLGKLKSLYLSNNKLTKLRNGTFEGLGSVYDLSLDNNIIEEIEPGTFEGLLTIGTLDLRNNSIIELKEGAFRGLAKLSNLFLSGNPIRTIHPSVFTIFLDLSVVKTDDHALCCYINSSITICDVKTKQPPPPYLSCDDHRLLPQDIMKTFIWIQVVVALSGNLLVLLWRGSKLKGHKRKPQMLLILSLALSDLLMGCYLLIIAVADLHYSDDFLLQTASWRASLTCKLAGVFGLVSSEASVFLLTIISWDRLMGVKFPFSRYRLTTRSTVKILTGLWILAFAVSITASTLSATDADFYELSNVCLGLPLSTKPSNWSMTIMTSQSNKGSVIVTDVKASGNKPAWVFPIVLFLGVNLLSFIMIFLCYIAIFISAKTSSKKSSRPANRAQEIRLAFKMGLIVGTDFCCWVPVIIMGILTQSGVVEIQQTMYAWAVIFILPINSSINPWLFTLSTLIPGMWRKVLMRSSTMTRSTSVPGK